MGRGGEMGRVGIMLMNDEFADLNPVLIRVPNRPVGIFLFDALFIRSISSIIVRYTDGFNKR